MNDRVDEYVDGGYDYKTRRVDPMPHKSFRIGDGRISGYLSCALGILSFLAVLCFLFPSYLTTAELRAAYDVEFLKTVLMVGMIFFGCTMSASCCRRLSGTSTTPILGSMVQKG